MPNRVTEVEAERKYLVYRQHLPSLSQGWMFVQGHRTEGKKDISVRMIPACNIAFLREKDHAFGIRHKSYETMPLRDAIAELKMGRYKVAQKTRYLIMRDPQSGRPWLIDEHPEHNGLMLAETEFPTPQAFRDFMHMGKLPRFAGREVTWSDHGYTRNLGRPLTPQEIDQAVERAMQGCREPYDPDKAFKPHAAT